MFVHCCDFSFAPHWPANPIMSLYVCVSPYTIQTHIYELCPRVDHSQSEVQRFSESEYEQVRWLCVRITFTLTQATHKEIPCVRRCIEIYNTNVRVHKYIYLCTNCVLQHDANRGGKHDVCLSSSFYVSVWYTLVYIEVKEDGNTAIHCLSCSKKITTGASTMTPSTKALKHETGLPLTATQLTSKPRLEKKKINNKASGWDIWTKDKWVKVHLRPTFLCLIERYVLYRVVLIILFCELGLLRGIKL